MHHRRLHAARKPRKPVTDAARAVLVGVDREASQVIQRFVGLGLEPEHGLTLDRERQNEVGQQRAIPRARGENQPIRGVGVGRRRHPDAAPIRFPVERGLAEAPFGSRVLRELDVRPVACFGIEKTRARVEHSDESLVEMKGRESLSHLFGSENLVRQSMLLCAAQSPGNDGTVGRADHDSAGDRHQ